MKKYFLIITTLLLFFVSNSCREKDLEMFPPNLDEITKVDTEGKLQQLLNGGYLSIASTSVYGTRAMVYGDLRADKMYVSTNPSFLDVHNYNYNGLQQDFAGLYGDLYSVIAKSNLVINNTEVPNSSNLVRLKAEAKILRGLAYFTLVNYYSPSPTSGVNQEFGVPIVLGNFDVNIKPERSTVAQVYNQIISDLNEGIAHANASPSSKTILGQTAAKLLLSRVYLTRRASGDAQLALQLATEVRDLGATTAGTFGTVGNVSGANYLDYYTGTDAYSEEHAETIWELDLNADANRVTGIGANMAIPCYYNRQDPKRCFLFNQTFYNSFATTDVRRGSTSATSLLTSTGVPTADSPRGYWTNKYPRLVSGVGNYFRNIKILRFSEAYLNRIEALYLMNQPTVALTELNAFATSRSGFVYTGSDLLNDILTERSKEFYGEGQRFFDLKRYNLPVSRPSNCTVCDISANDKLLVFPVAQDAINNNPNLKQYPGYN